MKDVFREKLIVLINCESIDTELNMPDYVIAESIIEFLRELKATKKYPETYRGRLVEGVPYA